MNNLQLSIWKIVTDWGHSNKEPITLKELASALGADSASKENVKSSLRALIKKGYIRKGVSRNKGSCYVQLRTASAVGN